MPELETPPVAVPPAEPAAAAAAEPGSIDDMLDGMGLTKSAEAAPAEAAPAKGDKPKPTDKPADKPAAKTGTPAAPPGDGEKKDRGAPLREELANIKAKYAELEKTHANAQREQQEKIRAFEKQETLTADHKKQLERAKNLEAELYARDYTESPEYKNKYQSRWDKVSANAFRDVRLLTIKTTVPTEDGGTEEKSRAATPQDLQRVLNAASRIEAEDLADELFGKRAGTVMKYRDDLEAIREEANTEVDNRRKTFDSDRQKAIENWNNQQKQALAIRDEQTRMLQEQYPEWFGDGWETEDEKKALKEGLELVDRQIEDPVELQRTLATLRLAAAAFKPAKKLIDRLRAENTQLKDDLGKYRKSDPGSGGAGGAMETPDDANISLDKMEQSLNSL